MRRISRSCANVPLGKRRTCSSTSCIAPDGSPLRKAAPALRKSVASSGALFAPDAASDGASAGRVGGNELASEEWAGATCTGAEERSVLGDALATTGAGSSEGSVVADTVAVSATGGDHRATTGAGSGGGDDRMIHQIAAPAASNTPSPSPDFRAPDVAPPPVPPPPVGGARPRFRASLSRVASGTAIARSCSSPSRKGPGVPVSRRSGGGSCR